MIADCTEVRMIANGYEHTLEPISQDTRNDLALLKVDYVPVEVFGLATAPPSLMEDVFVAGFPFGNRFSSSVKVTKGIVSSLTGIGDNSSELQIDAAIQPGSSGGPIYNSNGNVVGVAVSKLSALRIAKDYGVLPENINFGIKSSTVRAFLHSSRIEVEMPSDIKPSNKELSLKVSAATLLISCWK